MLYHDRKRGKYKTKTGLIKSNEERDKRIVEYIEKGMKVSDVAKIVNIRSSAVMRIFNNNNGKLPTPPKWDIKEARKMKENGESYYAISQYFGICNKTVERRLGKKDGLVKKGDVDNLKLEGVKKVGFMGMMV